MIVVPGVSIEGRDVSGKGGRWRQAGHHHGRAPSLEVAARCAAAGDGTAAPVGRQPGPHGRCSQQRVVVAGDRCETRGGYQRQSLLHDLKINIDSSTFCWFDRG